MCALAMRLVILGEHHRPHHHICKAPRYFGQFELCAWAPEETGWPTGPHRAQGHDHFLAARSPLGELQLAQRKSHLSATHLST